MAYMDGLNPMAEQFRARADGLTREPAASVLLPEFC